jgi:opacity protein-like surface antigen
LSDDVTMLNVNADLAYRFSSDWGQWSPYLGGGLGFYSWGDDRGLRSDSHNDLGASVLGGLETGVSSGNRFFMEMKLGLVDAPDMKLGVGWTFY